MIAVIINPIAGGPSGGTARDRAQRALHALQQCDEESEIFLSERRGHARDLAAAAVRQGVRLVIAWGGDGTVNEVATAVSRTSAAIGFVPAGSGNGLARELGVSFRPDAAIVDAARATPRQIDAAELGGKPFFNLAGIGFDAHVADCLSRDAASRRGLRAYTRIALRELLHYSANTYRVDGAAPCPALLIAIANSSQFGNGARIAPGAQLDDGRLDVVVVRERSRFASACAVPRLFVGGLSRLAVVSSQQAEQVTVTSDDPMIFHVDGEPHSAGHELTARVYPRALRVCVR